MVRAFAVMADLRLRKRNVAGDWLGREAGPFAALRMTKIRARARSSVLPALEWKKEGRGCG